MVFDNNIISIQPLRFIMSDIECKQYAVMDISNDDSKEKIYVLFAAGEYGYFNNKENDEPLQAPENDDGYMLDVCYGRFIVNKAIFKKISPDIIKEVIADSIDKWLIALDEHDAYWLGIKDIKLMPNNLTYKCSCGCEDKESPVFDLAFAALVSSPNGIEKLTNQSIYDGCGDIKLIDKFKTNQFVPSSLPATVRYSDFELYENIIKRFGIFSLGYTMPKIDNLSIDNWKNNINDEDLLSVAELIR